MGRRTPGWASASDDGDVLRIDPATRTITRIDERTGKSAGAPIRIAPASNNPNYAAAYAIAPAGTAIWATSQTTNTISRIQAQP